MGTPKTHAIKHQESKICEWTCLVKESSKHHGGFFAEP